MLQRRHKGSSARKHSIAGLVMVLVAGFLMQVPASAAGAVTGTVYNAAGAPLANARIDARESSGNSDVGVGPIYTGVDGTFTAEFPAGDWDVQASPPSDVPEVASNLAHVSVADNAPTAPIELHLLKSVISGVVRVPAPGNAGVSGGHVELMNQDHSHVSGAQASEDGTYRLFANPGQYFLRAYPPQDTPFGPSPEVSVTVNNVDSPVGADLVLVQSTQNPGGGGGPNQGPPLGGDPGNINGAVLVPGDSPGRVGHARVTLRRDYEFIDFAETDDQGNFHLTAGAGAYTLIVEAPDGSSFAPPLPVSVTINDEGNVTSPQSLQLRMMTANVTGHVFAPNHETTVANTNIEAHTQDWSFRVQTRSSTDGSYNLYLPPSEDPYYVDTQPDFQSEFGSARTVRVNVPQNGNATADPSFDLVLQNFNVVGRLLNPGNSTEGVGNTQIDLRGNGDNQQFGTGTQTDEQGNFRLAAPPGDYTLTGSAPQGSSFAASAPVHVVINNSGTMTEPVGSITLRLTVANVTGIVLPSGNGNTGVGGSHVQIHNGNFSYFADTQANEEGRFFFNIPPGQYAISAEPPFGNTEFTRTGDISFEVAKDGTVINPDVLNLRLLQPNLRGSVVKPDASAAVNASVQIRSSDYRFWRFAQADQTGHFSMNVPEGTYVIWASPAPGSSSTGNSVEVPVTVTSNGTVIGLDGPLTLRVPNVTGRVLQPGNSTAPVANASVQVRQSDDFSKNFNVQSDGSGNFALALAPGKYVVKVDPPFGSPFAGSAEQNLTVPQSGGVTLDVHTTVPNVSGTVRVPAPGSTGVAEAMVELRSVDKPESYNGWTDNNGGFHLSAPPGAYVVTAYPGQGSSYSQSIESNLVITQGQNISSLDLRLTSPNIAGTVVASNGTPVDNAMVNLVLDTGDYVAGTQADKMGHFNLYAKPGTYRVSAKPSGDSTEAASQEQTVVVDKNNSGPTDVTLALTKPNVTALVLAPGDSKDRIANVNVNVHTSDWSINVNGQTDSNGVARMRLAPGEYVLNAEAPFGSAEYGRSPDVPVVVTDTGDVSVTARLTRPNVTGTVYLPNGTPVGKASVNIESENHDFFTYASTDSEGVFRATVPSGGTYIATAQPPQGNSLGNSVATTLTVSQSGALTSPVPLNLTLTQPAFVGQVFDPGADAVSQSDDVVAANGYVSVHNADFSISTNGQVRSDGRFSIGGLAPGSYTMDVFPPWGKPGLLRATLNVTVPADSASLPVTVESTPGSGRIYLGKATNSITVAVARQDNTPITSGARVQAFNENGGFVEDATADNNGRYELNVADGNWQVSVTSTTASNDWVYTARPVVVNAASCTNNPCVSLKVEPAGATITGQVLKPDNSPATSNSAYVDVRTPDGKGNGSSIGFNGQFSIKVPAGTYSVTVHPNDSRLSAPATVKVTAASNQTLDVGTLKMVQRTSRIQGRVAFSTGNTIDANSTSVANASVFAFQPGGGGFADGQTQTDGTFTLNVTPGDWQVGIWAKPGDNWIYTGAPQIVTVAADQTATAINFPVKAAATTVRGQVVNPDGTISSVDGYVSLEGNNGNGGGAPLINGSFAIPTQAGTYSAKVFLAPGSPYTAPAPTTVTVGNTGTVTPSPLRLELVQNNATLSGHVVNASGGAVALDDVVVSASRNGQYVETRTDASGNYTLALAPGAWQIATRSDDPGYGVSGFRNLDNTPASLTTAISTVTLTGGSTATRNVAVVPASFALSGTVVAADNSPAGNAWVRIDTSGDATVPVHTGAYTNASGAFSVNLPAGTYDVGASGGPAGQLEPQSVHVTVGSTGQTPSSLQLAFRSPPSTITGLVRLSGAATPVAADVQAWSTSGGFATTRSDPSTGAYTLNVTDGDTWHVSASTTDPTNANRALLAPSRDVEVAAGASPTNVNLDVAAVTVPNGVSASFDAASAQVITLGQDTPSTSDDATITVPAGALGTSGNVRIVATPIADPNQVRGTKPVGLGYDLQAFDAAGLPILSTFNRSLTISFSYDPAALTASGLEPADLVPSYWDGTSRTYRRATSAVVDTTNNIVTFTTDHFTPWVVAAAVTTPGAPTAVHATGGSGSAAVTWTAPTDTGGSPITGYVVVASPGGATATTNGATSVSVGGLSNGTAYTFTVTAINGVGVGTTSAVSNQITPAGGGGAPPVGVIDGYRLLGMDGAIYNFGGTQDKGSPSDDIEAPVVGGASTSDGEGYWYVTADGAVYEYGTAGHFGDASDLPLNSPIVGMAATPSGNGYWLVAADGGIFGYGDAHFFGSMGGQHLNSPVVGMASTQSGNGYWLVAADGGIFTFGDGNFHGSMGGKPLNSPVVGMAALPHGDGYWLVAADGGIFTYGVADFHGSMGGTHLNSPISGMLPNSDGSGYRLVSEDGGVFSFNAEFYGSAGSNNVAFPVVAIVNG